MRTPIDNFHGRRITGIISHGGGAADWGIQLEGDVIIWNTDDRRKATPDGDALTGLSFISSDVNDDNTDLDFGIVDSDGQIQNAVGISLTTSQYRIVGPGISDADALDYSGSSDEVELPPDPSPERVADGPSEEWIESQQDAPDHAAWVREQEEAARASETPQEATDGE